MVSKVEQGVRVKHPARSSTDVQFPGGNIALPRVKHFRDAVGDESGQARSLRSVDLDDDDGRMPAMSRMRQAESAAQVDDGDVLAVQAGKTANPFAEVTV